MIKKKKKVVLAYSGGLDTSVILKWLVNKNYDVIAFIADVGQQEDFEKTKEKAFKIGASKVFVADLKKEFVESFIFPALKANAVYESQYLLGTSLARPLIAKKQVETAKKEGTNILSHGCTGKGNDQVRFELAWMYLMPDVQIISPWKDSEFLSKFKGRKDLINYAKEQGIPISATLQKSYSIDENLMHSSFESGVLENSLNSPDEKMFLKTVSPVNAPDKETKLIIEFEKGIPIKVSNLNDKKEVSGSLKLFQYLNKLGGENGIGRIDIIENRFVGIKSRGVYETPAGTILLKCHQDLESIVLDKDLMHFKELLGKKTAELIYNGFWFSSLMQMLLVSINETQKKVSGKTYLKLYKGNIIITGRESSNSLYNKEIASMDVEGGFNQQDSKGFIAITGLPLKLQGILNKSDVK